MKRWGLLAGCVGVVLGCSGWFGSPCDAMLTAEDVQALAPTLLIEARRGFTSREVCMLDHLPAGVYQTWAQVDARDRRGYRVGRARLAEQHARRDWLEIRDLAGEGWTAQLAEARTGEAAERAAEEAAERMRRSLEGEVEAIERGGRPSSRDPIGDALGALPPEQHVWEVVGPTWSATFLLDKDLLEGEALDAFVRKTAARVP